MAAAGRRKVCWDRKDERINEMDLRASTAPGTAVLGAVRIGLIVEITQDEDGMPYAWRAAIDGVAYIVAIVVMRFRRWSCPDIRGVPVSELVRPGCGHGSRSASSGGRCPYVECSSPLK